MAQKEDNLICESRTMKNRAAIIIFLSILLSGGHCIAAIAVTQTSSPSFYCHKKVSPIEALICSDNKLSKLDSQLAKKFSETKATNKTDANYLITDQRKWLKKRIQQCSYNGKDEAPADDKRQDYISCLQRLYEQRIAVLFYPEFWPLLREVNVARAIAKLRTMNPQDLYNITTDENRDTLSDLSCRFFEKDPKAASQTFTTYFGSSMDGWNPLCSKIDVAEQVPEVKALLKTLEPISGASTACDGTMRYAYGRSEMITRILAAVDPDPLSRKNDKKKHSSELAEEDIGYKPDLKHWSQQGNWEKRQYDALQPILNNAKNALQSYYHTKFEVNKDQASEGAG